VTAGATALGAGAAVALPATLVGVVVGGVVAYAVGADWDSIESTAEDLLP
jgi:ABC-type dipeptide/oligopeptide/nickel transport system permease subunit